MEQERYEEWRRKIPWTDDEIVAALEELIAAIKPGRTANAYEEALKGAIRVVRKGHFSKKIFELVAPLLVKYCNICAMQGKKKKALYRIGIDGRCSEHRTVSTAFKERIIREYDQRMCARSQERNAQEKNTRRRQALKKSAKGSGGGGRMS